MLKKRLSSLTASRPGQKVVAWAGHAARRLDANRHNQLLALTYHAVNDAVTFESHMSFLAANYQAVCLRDVLHAFSGSGPPLPPGARLW